MKEARITYGALGTVETIIDYRKETTTIVVKSPLTLDISDGYHTVDELYEHRIELFVALCRHMHELLGMENPGKFKVWRSMKHSAPDASGKELPMFDGWYVMGIGTEPGKQISYHLPISTWESTEFAETLEHAPSFDGHTPQDVIERLKVL